jgi:hypothetical protein
LLLVDSIPHYHTCANLLFYLTGGLWGGISTTPIQALQIKNIFQYFLTKTWKYDSFKKYLSIP